MTWRHSQRCQRQGGPRGRSSPTPKEQGKLTAFFINYSENHSIEHRKRHWEISD